ncbi:MAG TPA: hypothetical protein VEK07_03880 [Polyangiaceae bacterium]|nr:hypothetical protein [Polyangiaceae bacterium]
MRGGSEGTVWRCPNGSGDIYPAVADFKVELHYRAGDERPWVAKWTHPTERLGEIAAKTAADALALAGQRIEQTLEEKSPEELAIEKAIHPG